MSIICISSSEEVIKMFEGLCKQKIDNKSSKLIFVIFVEEFKLISKTKTLNVYEVLPIRKKQEIL